MFRDSQNAEIFSLATAMRQASRSDLVPKIVKQLQPILILFLSGLFSIATSGCDRQTPPDLTPRFSELERRQAAESIAIGKAVDMEARLTAIEAKVRSQATAMTTLKGRIDSIQSKEVFLDPSTPNFQTIETDSGRFLISCKEVRPYLDGQKLILEIGNPNYATYSGFTLKAKWGRSPPDLFSTNTTWDAYQEWEKSLRERQIDCPAKLSPGIWNTVEIVLTPAKPDELGFLQMSMTTNTVSMITKEK